jgi:hypothetical protein
MMPACFRMLRSVPGGNVSLGCQPPRTRTRYQPSASSNLIISPTFDGMRVPKQTGRTIMRYGCGGGSGCWRRNREDRCSVTCVGLPTVMEVLGHSTYRLTMDTLRVPLPVPSVQAASLVMAAGSSRVCGAHCGATP